MAINISNARYIYVDGRRILEFYADGIRVRIGFEAKQAIRRLGWVCLGSEFENILPEVELPPDKKTGRPAHVLRGFTNDEKVLKLFDRYMEDLENGTFRPKRLTV
ncbi:MAG TPA: hypothetical protein EYP04_10760 [Anaerolineae bacterium]|nr:hypothetical protein [Anaerolineae bacterium]